MLHREYSKAKHDAKVIEALRAYKAVYAHGGETVKQAEAALNAAVEAALSPKST
jgi:hypothetical protein